MNANTGNTRKMKMTKPTDEYLLKMAWNISTAINMAEEHNGIHCTPEDRCEYCASAIAYLRDLVGAAQVQGLA